MKFWIAHPATQGEGPVGFRRWLAWHIAERLGQIARRLEWYALYRDDPDRYDIPF